MRTTMLIATTLATAVILMGCGRPSVEERDARMTKRIEGVLEEIKATPEQKQQILAVTNKTKDALRAQREARGATREALIAQWNSDKPDPEAVRLSIDEATARFIANGHTLVDAGVAIHQTLTKEQRAQLEDKLPVKRARFAMNAARFAGYGPPATKEELRKRADERFSDVMDDIKATEDQRARLSPLVDEVLVAVQPLLESPPALREALLAAWNSDEPDAGKLHALVDAEGAKLSNVAQTAGGAIVKAHAVLTPEQRQQISARLAEGGCDHDQ